MISDSCQSARSVQLFPLNTEATRGFLRSLVVSPVCLLLTLNSKASKLKLKSREEESSRLSQSSYLLWPSKGSSYMGYATMSPLLNSRLST